MTVNYELYFSVNATPEMISKYFEDADIKEWSRCPKCGRNTLANNACCECLQAFTKEQREAVAFCEGCREPCGTVIYRDSFGGETHYTVASDCCGYYVYKEMNCIHRIQLND